MSTDLRPDQELDPRWPPIHRMSAFTTEIGGGNPAGVVITDAALEPNTMQDIASAVGYSETAFLCPAGSEADRRYQVRYFAPEAEVSFCGHATIASGVLLGRVRGEGRYDFETNAGPVNVEVRRVDSRFHATLTSVPPEVSPAGDELLDGALAALRWERSDLDPAFEPAIAYAGARHLTLVTRTRQTLADLDYDFDRLRSRMSEHDLTTVALLWREDATHFHARNPFPPGGVVEDPATGAAAAAFGAYLRAQGHLTPPADLLIRQGDDMGRPSQIFVHVPAGEGGIEVSGTAITLEPEPTTPGPLPRS